MSSSNRDAAAAETALNSETPLDAPPHLRHASHKAPRFIRPRPAPAAGEFVAAESAKNGRGEAEVHNHRLPAAWQQESAVEADLPPEERPGVLDRDQIASDALLREAELRDEERAEEAMRAAVCGDHSPAIPVAAAPPAQKRPVPKAPIIVDDKRGWGSGYYARGEAYCANLSGAFGPGLRKEVVKFAIEWFGQSAPEYQWIGEELLERISCSGEQDLYNQHDVAKLASTAAAPSGFVPKRPEPKPEKWKTPRFLKPRAPPTTMPDPDHR